jgi:hypothetical protein
MLAAAAARLDSVAAAALVPEVLVLVVLVPVVPVPVPHEAELPALAPPVLVRVHPGVLVLAQVPPGPVLLHLLPLLSRLVVVESGGPLHLQGRQSFSAATARSSPPTGKPTYERAPSTR